MPLTWDDLIDTNPADTEPVSNGANRIRQVIQAGKTATDLEHYQTGEHQFPVSQPGAPKENQIWFDLVNMVLRRYDGTDHTQLNAVGLQFATGAASTAMTATYVTIASVSVTTFVGSRVFLLSQLGATTTTQLSCKFVRGVTDVSSRVGNFVAASFATAVTMVFVDIDAPSAGTYTYAIQAKTATAGTGFATTPLIAALVL